MSDFDGGAPAPADGGAAPSNEPAGIPVQQNSSQEQGLGSQTPVAEKPPAPEPEAKPEPKPEPSKSNREALEKAFKTVEAKRDEAKAPAKPVEAAPEAQKDPAKPEATRGEDGRFAPREPAQKALEAQPQPSQNSPHRDAPQRFDDAAKSEWANAPESVKGAIHRTIRELEQGHQKYKADAEEFETVRQFSDMAKRGGTNLRAALETYAGLEQMIEQNPIGALDKIAQMKGFTLRQVAEHVMGQTPDQQANQRDQEIIVLKQTISQLQQQIGGVTQTFQQQQNDATLASVQAFASRPEYSRFDELADDISFFLTSGRTSDLAEAYQLAERLNPAPSSKPLIPADIPAPAQTRTESQPNPAGLKSISGAPSSGSDPTRSAAPSSSNREALRKAFARQGL